MSAHTPLVQQQKLWKAFFYFPDAFDCHQYSAKSVGYD